MYVPMAKGLPRQKIYGLDGWLAAWDLHTADLRIANEENSSDHGIIFLTPSVPPWSQPRNQEEFDEIERTVEQVLANLEEPIVIRGSPRFEPAHTYAAKYVSRFEQLVLQKHGDSESLVEVQVADAYNGTPTACQPAPAAAVFSGPESLPAWQLNQYTFPGDSEETGLQSLYTMSRRQFIDYGTEELTSGLNMLSGTTSRPSSQAEWLRRSAPPSYGILLDLIILVTVSRLTSRWTTTSLPASFPSN